MNELYQTPYIVLPGASDASGRLGLHSAFSVFMDLATVHADLLGFGYRDLVKRGLFWLTVKTKVHFEKRPRMDDEVMLRTWPEAPGKVRCNRSYEILRDGVTLVRGKTEWAVINTATQELVPIDGIYPEGLALDRPTACAEPFARIRDNFDGAAPYAEYRVRSIDIDVGGHMNNAAYVRELIASFSNSELKAMGVRDIDVIFRKPCYEGDVLSFCRRDTEDGIDVRVSKDGETVLLARLA